MGSWFKVDVRLVVQNPADWSKSPLGVFSELTHEALMVFLFLKVAGNFQMTFRVNRDVLARIAGFTGNGQDVDDILDELEMRNLIQVHGQDFFLLTDNSAVRKAEIPRMPSVTITSIPEPFLTVEQQRDKAFAGLRDLDELGDLCWNNILTPDEYKRLRDECKYLGERPPGLRTETKKQR